MVKVVQVPVLFTISSECPRNNYNGAFLVLIFEKLTRKRTYARSINQHQRLRKIADMKKKGKQRFVDDQMFVRDLKTRRFANYFLTLFDMHYIDPFTQFIKKAQVTELKTEVKQRLELVLEQMNSINEAKPKEQDQITISEEDSDDSLQEKDFLIDKSSRLVEKSNLITVKTEVYQGSPHQKKILKQNRLRQSIEDYNNEQVQQPEFPIRAAPFSKSKGSGTQQLQNQKEYQAAFTLAGKQEEEVPKEKKSVKFETQGGFAQMMEPYKDAQKRAMRSSAHIATGQMLSANVNGKYSTPKNKRGPYQDQESGDALLVEGDIGQKEGDLVQSISESYTSFLEHPFKLKEFNETEQKVKAVIESPPKIWRQHNNIEDESVFNFNENEEINNALINPMALEGISDYEEMKKSGFSFKDVKVEMGGQDYQ